MEVSTIGKLCNVIGGKPAPSEKEAFENGVVPFLRMKDLGAYHLTNNLVNIKDKLNLEYVKRNNLKPIKRGAILLPRSGSVALNHRAILGVDAVIVSHVCALEILNEKILDRKYFYYYMTRVNMANITKKTTGLDAITFEDLRQIKIPLPEKETQQKIAGILEQADAARQKRKQANALTEQFLQSAFLEMFGDPVRNERGWVVGKIDEVVESTQYGLSKKSNQEGIGFPILGMGNITNDGQIDLAKFNFVEISDAEFVQYELKKGDIIFNRTNSTDLVGKTAYWDSDNIKAVLASYLIRIKLNAKFNPICFSYLLNSNHFKNFFRKRCKKAVGQSNISPTLLREFPLYIPPIKIQNEFSSLVNNINILRLKQLESERYLQELFNSLMQRYFG